MALEPGLPEGEFVRVLATSGAAFAFAGPMLARLAGAPLLLVGERTARAAFARGLGGEARVFADVAALAAALPTRLDGASLYLAGRDRKPDLEQALDARGMACVTVETYAAQARAAWTADEIEGLASCHAYLHYSRRSAELAVALAGAAGLGAVFAARRHVVLSGDVALALHGVNGVSVAVTPDEAGVFAMLGSIFPSGGALPSPLAGEGGIAEQ